MKISASTIIVKLLGYLVVALLYFLEAAVAVWLWNTIVVSNFGLAYLNYWEMYGLIWLVSLVFGRNTISSVDYSDLMGDEDEENYNNID